MRALPTVDVVELVWTAAVAVVVAVLSAADVLVAAGIAAGVLGTAGRADRKCHAIQPTTKTAANMTANIIKECFIYPL